MKTILTFLWNNKATTTIIILLIFIFFLFKYAEREHNENVRKGINQQSLLDTIKVTKDKNGIYQSEITALTLTKSELKDANDKLLVKMRNEAQNSSIATRKIETLQNVLATTELLLKAKTRDAVIIRDSVPINAKYASFDSEFYDINVIDCVDTIYIDVKSYSDLIIIKSWQRKGFWLWRWLMKKDYSYTVKDLNPYTTIKQISVVEIKK